MRQWFHGGSFDYLLLPTWMKMKKNNQSFKMAIYDLATFI
jgi:hypothetical protein